MRGEEYDAQLVRIVNGDLNPDAGGFEEEDISCAINGTHRGGPQEIRSGSYIVVPAHPAFQHLTTFTLQCFVWPTMPSHTLEQGLIGCGSDQNAAGYRLGLDTDGQLTLWIGSDDKWQLAVRSDVALQERTWYLVAAGFDATSGRAFTYQRPILTAAAGGLGPAFIADPTPVSTTAAPQINPPANADGPLVMAALAQRPVSGTVLQGAHYGPADGTVDLPLLRGHYNGKIERPRIIAGFLTPTDIEALAAPDAESDSRLIAAWNFDTQISSTGVTSPLVTDISANHLSGYCINLPSRGVTGAAWTGRTLGYVNAPSEHGAIHFHEDDLDDARWNPAFTLTVPDGLRSGGYAVRFSLPDAPTAPTAEEYVPFYVRPAQPSADLAVIIPTATYLAYANDRAFAEAEDAEVEAGKVMALCHQDVFLAAHPEYGLSLYETHLDGSGSCYSTRLRPLLNMRPKYRAPFAPGPSSLWALNSDYHLLTWLDREGIPYDVHTDEDLDREGLELLRPYKAVVTGTHPEYTSENMLDSIYTYLNNGGRLIYLGGNGFYWVTCFHPENPAVIEVRRGETGTRSWQADPGELWNAFDGRYGGLWRGRGRIPARMAGVTFAAAGFDVASYYRRDTASYTDDTAWIFDGVDTDTFGDCGLLGGGAAGLEVDRAGADLGTPPHAILLGSSERHSDLMMGVTDDIFFHLRGYAQGGDSNPHARADIVYFTTPNNGAVFSTGSIGWCGSLLTPHNNTISRITHNIITTFTTTPTLPPHNTH